jgi:hypothetical protein
MSESPEIRIESLKEAHDSKPGSKPAYVAQLFKGTLKEWPEAKIKIFGDLFLANEVEKSLVSLGVARGKIEILPFDASKIFNLPGSSGLNKPAPSFWTADGSLNIVKPNRSPIQTVSVTILYLAAAKRNKVTMQFKPDSGDSLVDLNFDVSPDGTEIEVGAEVTAFKNYIKNISSNDRIRSVKIATKVIGLAQFNVEIQNKVAVKLKTKIKEALTLEIVKGLAIEFYVAGVAEYGTAKKIELNQKDEKANPKFGGEAGLGVTITFRGL